MAVGARRPQARLVGVDRLLLALPVNRHARLIASRRPSALGRSFVLWVKLVEGRIVLEVALGCAERRLEVGALLSQPSDGVAELHPAEFADWRRRFVDVAVKEGSLVW